MQNPAEILRVQRQFSVWTQAESPLAVQSSTAALKASAF